MATEAAMSKSEIVAFLEEYSAAESAGAMVAHVWIAACKSAPLRGALKLIELRERAHADLLTARAKELGGSGSAQPNAMGADFDTYLAMMGANDRTDAEKLREFLRFAQPEEIVDRLNGQAARMAADPESQALLRAIIDDERSTLWSLREFAMEAAAAA